MNLLISVRAELLKTKRSAAFWLSVASAAFIPVLFFLVYLFEPNAQKGFGASNPWNRHFTGGWQFHAAFLLPMFIILICSLITQIEFKNNTWKQVFASPQSIGAIYFSKFIAIHLMIFFFLLLFNVLMVLSAVLINLINSKFPFFHHTIDYYSILRLTLKMYISILGLSALQYWISLRIKNFIGPVGIGLAMYIGGAISLGVQWKHMYKIPTIAPGLTLMYNSKVGRPLLENHEWNSIGYFIVFVIIGFLDVRFRKAKG